MYEIITLAIGLIVGVITGYFFGKAKWQEKYFREKYKTEVK